MTNLLLTRTEDDALLAYFQDVRIVDESRIESLGHDLMNLISAATHDKLVLNFQNVAFMSSAMIGKLILFGKKCKTSGVTLRVCGINNNIKQVFDLMHLDKVFDIDETEDESLAKMSKKGGWFGRS